MRKLSFLSASLPRLPVAATRAWGKTCAPRTCPMGLGSAVDDSTASAVLSWCCFLRVALATRLCGSLPHRLCGMVVQQEVVLAVLGMGSIHWLLCNVLHLLHMACSSMALHSTSIWRVLLQFRKLSHLELATPCSCHRSSEGHLQRLTAPRGTPTASVAALELASRTPATLLARARTPRMVERQRCRMPSGWPGFVYPQYRPHPRQRRPEGRATDHHEGGTASPGCDEPDPVTSRLA